MKSFAVTRSFSPVYGNDDTSKCRIFKEIIKEKITLDMIQKSVFYEKRCIEERISHLSLLEAMLDKDSDIYKINKKAYARYTTIVADYLTERQYSDHETYYLFSVVKNDVNSGSYDECTCCSFFKRHDMDYRYGTFLTSLLILRKYEHYNTPEQKLITEYISPSYHL